MKKQIIITLILLSSVLVRFYNLGDPPLFFDESIHSVFVNSVLKGTYKYDPAYHGPLLFYSIAPIVSILGENEFSLRLVPSILGVLSVFVIILYRKFIGNSSLIAASFVAVSPVIVNYSRFCRADIYQVLFTLLFVYFIFNYIFNKKFNIEKRGYHLILASVSLALFACVKETFYPFLVIFLVFFIFDYKKINPRDFLISVIVFLSIYLTFYTNFWRYTEFLANLSNFPAIKAINYWRHQHEIARISGPWYYYLEILLLYDLPAFILAIFGIFSSLREKNEFKSFLVYWFIASLIFFSYMQEKVPWLVIHVEVPMFIIAADAIEKIRVRKIKYASLIFTFLYLVYGCLAINIVNPVNPAEPALYMPTQYDVREFVSTFDKNDTIYVFTTVGEYWPLAWYLKGYRAYYFTSGVDNIKYWKAKIIISNMTNSVKIVRGNWRVDKMVVRCWSFWTNPKIERIPNFILKREPFSTVDCMNFTVFTRSG